MAGFFMLLVLLSALHFYAISLMGVLSTECWIVLDVLCFA